ncbi:hypothetical protein [Chryseobacterium artocarpi]|uniref:hypothetical protein n=1 Tax=Chryseobacterium artocarpi TaxID=1414727 RepID=UPI003F2C5518
MARLKNSDVLKVEVLSLSEWSVKYGGGIKNQSIAYAMEKDKLDYITLGNVRYIVMTAKTKAYVPNSHPSRSRMGT